MIFVKYREVSTRTILPIFIDLTGEIALYSRFGGELVVIERNWMRVANLNFAEREGGSWSRDSVTFRRTLRG